MVSFATAHQSAKMWMELEVRELTVKWIKSTVYESRACVILRAQRDKEVAALDREAKRICVIEIPAERPPRPEFQSKRKPPKPAPAPHGPSRLDALFQRIPEGMSVPSQRKVYKKAQELFRTAPAFQGI